MLTSVFIGLFLGSAIFLNTYAILTHIMITHIEGRQHKLLGFNCFTFNQIELLDFEVCLVLDPNVNSPFCKYVTPKSPFQVSIHWLVSAHPSFIHFQTFIHLVHNPLSESFSEAHHKGGVN